MYVIWLFLINKVLTKFKQPHENVTNNIYHEMTFFKTQNTGSLGNKLTRKGINFEKCVFMFLFKFVNLIQQTHYM